MRFLSVCSGIEAASVAWSPLGWKAVAFSEIEPFPCAVLAHHYPDTPNWGDMTKFEDWPDEPIDLLCGGTPCQSFSVAGLRKGLADPRGNLMLTFGAIAAKYRPEWLVWENVPGVLSSNGGRDFGAFLGMLGQLGYGFAYRVLDAQYFGVAQRRRRVFVVARFGDWRAAAAVLFERHSLSGHPAPSREAREGAAAGTLRSTQGGSDVDHARATQLIASGNAEGSTGLPFLTCSNIGKTVNNQTPLMAFADTAHTLRGEGFDASEDGTGRGAPLVPVAFPANLSSTQHASTENLAPAMGAKNPTAVAVQASQSGVRINETIGTLDANYGSHRHNGVMQAMQVRRLTPVECERLQGFPDGYTEIPWTEYQRIQRRAEKAGASFEAELRKHGKVLRGPTMPACPDGPRYKALGNSWAVPNVRWIGERIQQVHSILSMKEAA